jgi:hypothetical protein
MIARGEGAAYPRRDEYPHLFWGSVLLGLEEWPASRRLTPLARLGA